MNSTPGSDAAELLTVPEVAMLCGCSAPTIRRRIQMPFLGFDPRRGVVFYTANRPSTAPSPDFSPRFLKAGFRDG
jgi:hypothetical protein